MLINNESTFSHTFIINFSDAACYDLLKWHSGNSVLHVLFCKHTELDELAGMSTNLSD